MIVLITSAHVGELHALKQAESDSGVRLHTVTLHSIPVLMVTVYGSLSNHHPSLTLSYLGLNH